MSTDPFAEPSESEGTIIRPRPSGTAAAPDAFAARAAAPPGSGPARPVPKTGTNPLVAAAAPVLAAAVRVASSRGQPPDPDKLRRAMVAAIRNFETEALATGLDTRSLRAARYALCATIDDLVLSTPWGSASAWAQQSITSVFHNEVIGGDRFFEILDQMQKDLGRHAPVVELMYLCTSLGFEGRYRVMPRGVAALTELRDGVYRTVRQRRGDFERDLSPHWRGIAAGARPLSQRIPLWALGLGTLALACAMYAMFTFLLAGVSDVAFAELFGLPPAAPAAVPRPAGALPVPPPVQQAALPAPPPPAASRWQFLKPEIDAKTVEVFEDAQAVTIRLTVPTMFASGDAALGNAYTPLLVRIGDALQAEPGLVVVNGYTDNQAVRGNPRFPSNFELSQARAEAVGAVLRSRLADPKRVSAKGKSAENPVADNATAEGRQRNRRTEIVLIRPSDAQ